MLAILIVEAPYDSCHMALRRVVRKPIESRVLLIEPCIELVEDPQNKMVLACYVNPNRLYSGEGKVVVHGGSVAPRLFEGLLGRTSPAVCR